MIKFVLIYQDKSTEGFVLETINKYFDFLQNTASCNSLFSGVGAILANNPDLVIIEQSPNDKDVSVLIECLAHMPFKLMAIYPLRDEMPGSLKFHLFRQWDKPLNETRMTKDLIDVCYAILEQRIGRASHQQPNGEKKAILTIYADNEIHFIHQNDILWLSSEGAYTKIHTAGNPPLLVSKNMKQISDQLHPEQFLRTHHSYVVNMRAVAKYTKANGGQLVLFDGSRIPVSARKRADLFLYVENH